MTLPSIAHQRLHHQRISQSEFEKPEEVVSWMGAMQSQDYLGSLWSVGLRMKNGSEEMIEQALADKTIVRTWPMRGTLHLVAPADVRWMLKAFTPRIISRAAGIYKQEELDKKVFTKSAKLLVTVLEGGHQLTRKEVYDILERGKIATGNTRGLHILGYLAQTGLICFGARKGKQPTFTLLDEWIPAAKLPQQDEAIAAFALRYFASHGPATLQDFAWWTGLSITEVKAVHDAIKSKLIQETVQGNTYWMAADNPEVKPKTTSVYLLPGFDEYLLGYTNRSAAIDIARFKQIAGTGNGILSSTVVINSQVVGTWKRTVAKDTAVVELKPFASFTKTQKTAIASVARKYSAFLGTSLIKIV